MFPCLFFPFISFFSFFSLCVHVSPGVCVCVCLCVCVCVCALRRDSRCGHHRLKYIFFGKTASFFSFSLLFPSVLLFPLSISTLIIEAKLQLFLLFLLSLLYILNICVFAQIDPHRRTARYSPGMLVHRLLKVWVHLCV